MEDYFITFTPCRRLVSTATFQEFWTEGYSDAIADLIHFNTTKLVGSLRPPNTWLAPGLAHNLVSIRQLAKTKAFANTINWLYLICSTGQIPQADLRH